SHPGRDPSARSLRTQGQRRVRRPQPRPPGHADHRGRLSDPADTARQPNGDRPAGMLQPLRVRDFRLLWVGQTVSLLGDGVLSVALAWQTLDISPHPTSLALVLFARVLPRSILLLVGGAVSDRFQRRTLMLVAD